MHKAKKIIIILLVSIVLILVSGIFIIFKCSYHREYFSKEELEGYLSKHDIQKKDDHMSIEPVKIFCLCFALFGIMTICRLIDMYRKTVIAYKNNDYQIVEGYVENFDPMPHGGHKK